MIDIPLSQSEPDESKTYLIQFDDSSTVRIPLSMMPLLFPKAPVNIDDSGLTDISLPPSLQLNKRITYEHEG